MDLFRGVHQEVDVFISLRMSNTEGSLEEGRDIRRLMIFLIEFANVKFVFVCPGLSPLGTDCSLA
jgi:hypothetical protein